jgi:hypothetical protein
MSTKFAKLAVMACAIASAAAFSARAEPKVDATFGNTVESVYPAGRQVVDQGRKGLSEADFPADVRLQLLPAVS